MTSKDRENEPFVMPLLISPDTRCLSLSQRDWLHLRYIQPMLWFVRAPPTSIPDILFRGREHTLRSWEMQCLWWKMTFSPRSLPTYSLRTFIASTIYSRVWFTWIWNVISKSEIFLLLQPAEKRAAANEYIGKATFIEYDWLHTLPLISCVVLGKSLKFPGLDSINNRQDKSSDC